MQRYGHFFMADPVKDVEKVVEDVGLAALKKIIIAQIVAVVPALAGGPLGWLLGMAVGYIVNKLGVAGIVALGNMFIGFDTAHQAAKASESAQKLKEVLAKPDATPQEKQDAQKKFNDAYADLIHFNH